MEMILSKLAAANVTIPDQLKDELLAEYRNKIPDGSSPPIQKVMEGSAHPEQVKPADVVIEMEDSTYTTYHGG